MIKKLLVFIILFIIFYDIYTTFIIKKEHTDENNKLNNKIGSFTKLNNDIDSVTKLNNDNGSFTKLNNDIDSVTKLNNDNGSFTKLNNDIDSVTKLNNDNGSFTKLNNDIDSVTKLNNDNGSFTKLNNEINNKQLDIPIISPMMFGKPSEYKENEYIIWEFYDPSPWTKIIYKYNEKFPFYFFIKIIIPSLNDYQDWKNIINNINFNPKSGEIIIPTNDEESALSIANLMISNFKGDISLKDILNKNLIDISINKAKKYEVVKNKLIDQINNNIKIKHNFKDPIVFQKDLSIVEKIENTHESEYSAFEGNEYSFI